MLNNSGATCRRQTSGCRRSNNSIQHIHPAYHIRDMGLQGESEEKCARGSFGRLIDSLDVITDGAGMARGGAAWRAMMEPRGPRPGLALIDPVGRCHRYIAATSPTEATRVVIDMH